MADANYFVITVAKCDPTYVATAMEQIGSVIDDLKSKAGAIVVRAGIITTGEQAGSLALFQAYEGMDGFEKALDVYAASSDYAAMMASGKVSVVMRNLLKIHAVPFDQNTTKTPKFIVLTRVTAADTMIDTVTQLAPIFADGGALTLRYGTLVTGSNAGNRLLGVTYPSMAAIEKTYDALTADAAYQAALSSFNVNLRAIVRVMM
ncbi:MAG: hypothetical protein MK323_08030 [Gammaproteobacteria bacterium]|jgi:hypothetical protein|nr:hypothetical protein [Gammaproteobacteria bacterium]HIM87695.1 hypothetical protein [Gammaproteobacteria bacterium]